MTWWWWVGGVVAVWLGANAALLALAWWLDVSDRW